MERKFETRSNDEIDGLNDRDGEGSSKNINQQKVKNSHIIKYINQLVSTRCGYTQMHTR